MIATYSGECAACGQAIHAGQRIIPAEDAGWGAGWVHSQCPSLPEVCDECWLEKPCGCYA